jgi:hypothetical protein
MKFVQCNRNQVIVHTLTNNQNDSAQVNYSRCITYKPTIKN